MAKKDKNPAPKRTCPNCLGSGDWWEPHPSGDPGKSKRMNCPWCNGSGER
jgi:DnaJ-class molecular chaperone